MEIFETAEQFYFLQQSLEQSLQTSPQQALHLSFPPQAQAKAELTGTATKAAARASLIRFFMILLFLRDRVTSLRGQTPNMEDPLKREGFWEVMGARSPGVGWVCCGVWMERLEGTGVAAV